MVRLQKYLAEAGVASRRAGEQMILAGRVGVNGRVVRELGTKVEPRHDEVTVDGQPVRAKRKIYLALNKPRGLVCSRKDEFERPTIYELLPKEWGHLHSVGRLDYNSEGLIFLTNDGEFSLRLTHPRYGVHKKYLATVEGRVDEEILGRFTRGITVQAVPSSTFPFSSSKTGAESRTRTRTRTTGLTERLKAEKARLVSAGESQSVVELELAEGKYREVRRLFESQGRTVKRLQRLQIGRIKLGELRPGRWRSLTEGEIKSLMAAGK